MTSIRKLIQPFTRMTAAFALLALLAANASAYIHFPPMTLAKMTSYSHQIRILKVEKFSKEKGVIIFACPEILKDAGSKITSYRVVIRNETTGTKPIWDWTKEGKQAVMFSIESKDREVKQAIAYVFIDDYCFTADHNPEGKYWLMIRGEPSMSACYHGPVDKLTGLVKDLLAGKDVTVPVKEPESKEDRDQRNKEINKALKENHPPKESHASKP
ncbi:MAG TPA: hypothetical protein VKS79_03400 [Gemmataceae bacterium]|nr:hypothetical protein [Gemmataceae bacterium]